MIYDLKKNDPNQGIKRRDRRNLSRIHKIIRENGIREFITIDFLSIFKFF